MTQEIQTQHFDVIVIGSGPAGQKAAVQAAKQNRSVALIESDRQLGGACVHRGTIPSKTLRENAMRIAMVRHHAELFNFELREDLAMASLISNLDQVLNAHDEYIERQIKRNNITRLHGRAGFVDSHSIELLRVNAQRERYSADYFVLATGSHPRKLDNVPVDHEHIYDSDSILSMNYLPKTLTVLGAGIIASEYASIFASLGVRVTMIDRYPRPLGFLDAELTERFIASFEAEGCCYVANATIRRVYWDQVSQVITELEDGRTIKSDKLLCAAGRVAYVKGLQLENAGLALNEHGVISVDENCRTNSGNIFAAGDIIGPPSLASTSMEQGRRASGSIVGMAFGDMSELIPIGIYAIPELSSIGMTEQQARKEHGDVLIGLARFEEIARGQISGITNGLLKMVACPAGKKLLGVHIVGEGATELIHIAQMGLLNEMPVDEFVDNIFNFPTLAEAYRVAALHIVGQRRNG